MITIAAENKHLMNDLVYALLKSDDASFGQFLHLVDVNMVEKPCMPGVPAWVGVKRDGTLELCFVREFFNRIPFNVAKEILKHEVLHFVHGHVSSRGIKLDKMYGSSIRMQASDLVVNQHLDYKLFIDAGISPTIIQVYGFPSDLSTPAYCELLKEHNESNKSTKNSSEPSQEQEDTSTGDDSLTEDQKWVQDFLSQQELMHPVFEIIETDESSKASLDTAVKNVLETVNNDCQAKSRGWESAEASEFLEELSKQPKVSWYYWLHRKVGRWMKIYRKPTRMRKSRRHPQHLGRIRRHGLAVAFIIDTSGSMGPNELKHVDAEIRNISSYNVHITIIHCDATVAKVETYHPGMQIDQFFGRGGTTFDPAFEVLKDMYPPPDFIVYFTDGMGSIDRDEEYDTLWVLTDGGVTPEDFRDNYCSWGDITVLETNK